MFIGYNRVYNNGTEPYYGKSNLFLLFKGISLTQGFCDKMALGQIIVSNFSTLLGCINPSNELLGRLLSIASVRNRISVIEEKATPDDKNYALLRALQEVPDDLQESLMHELIAGLRSCGQEHVATNIFRRESDKVPMSDDHRDMIATRL